MVEPQKSRDGWSENELAALERAHPAGITVHQIVEAFAAREDKLTEATFRKYVQLGLLPRSHRVGRKGKHRGSQGLYPASVVRQIDAVRRLMAQGHTMEEIQREFLFIRGDIEELRRRLDRIYAAVEQAMGPAADAFAGKQLRDARDHGTALMQRLEEIEQRMSMRARMARAAV